MIEYKITNIVKKDGKVYGISEEHSGKFTFNGGSGKLVWELFQKSQGALIMHACENNGIKIQNTYLEDEEIEFEYTRVSHRAATVVTIETRFGLGLVELEMKFESVDDMDSFLKIASKNEGLLQVMGTITFSDGRQFSIDEEYHRGEGSFRQTWEYYKDHYISEGVNQDKISFYCSRTI